MPTVAEITASLEAANPDTEVTFAVDGKPATFTGATVEHGGTVINLTTSTAADDEPAPSSSTAQGRSKSSGSSS
jgi:hypothetical protein